MAQSKPKWETHFFKVNRGFANESTAAGVAYGGLAMLKIAGRKDTWSLTHMRSGLRVIEIEGPLKEVRRIGAAIADLVDWPAYENGKEIAAAHPGVAQKIAAIAEFAETGGATAGSA